MKPVSIGVEYGRTAQVDGQYTSRSAKAIIQYAAEEGETVDVTVALKTAEAEAIKSVNRMLNIKGEVGDKSPATTAPAATTTAASVATVTPPETAKEAEKPKRETKKSKAADAASIGGEPAQAIQTGGGRVDPNQGTAASMEDVSAAIDFSEPIVTTTAPAASVSDGDLDKACQTKMQELTKKGEGVGPASTRIRELISKYNPAPGQPFGMKSIPADKRADFIAKLGAL